MVDKRLATRSRVGIDFLIQAHAARIVELAAQHAHTDHLSDA